jgi:hypothetical protein
MGAGAKGRELDGSSLPESLVGRRTKAFVPCAISLSKHSQSKRFTRAHSLPKTISGMTRGSIRSPAKQGHAGGSRLGETWLLTVQFPFGLEPVGQIVAMCTAAREKNLIGAELDLRIASPLRSPPPSPSNRWRRIRPRRISVRRCQSRLLTCPPVWTVFWLLYSCAEPSPDRLLLLYPSPTRPKTCAHN